ncbi:MAG: 1,4-alpha-glucan branching protein GlgB [Phycisphaerales bacterium]
MKGTARASADQPRFSADDLHLFNEGTHYRLADRLGSHALPGGGVAFAVWAPNASYVSVVGDFNGWDRGRHPMRTIGGSGIWEAVIPDAHEGSVYKFHIASRHNGYVVDKADPFAFEHEVPPRTGSVVRSLKYRWNDAAWMSSRGAKQKLDAPMSVYEVHLGSWMRVPEEGNRSLTYRELAPRLAEYVSRLGFTHVEFLPVMEHPFYGSWGYQTTGYFAPTSRFGSPQDFMYLIDYLHQHGIGVILDWVPSHFPTDEHGLGYFDGTHLFEHADDRQGFHPDWKSSVFNYGRHEVRSFLISSAIFWLEKYHADALRVDAVASMLYLDYGRRDGEWIPNEYGGRENIHAINFMRQMNSEIYRSFPDAQTIAEESTAWPMVSRPTYEGGLGFGMKWDMGWMHDTLRYFKREPIHRRYHHNDLNFRGMYMNSENYMLPLSHDEVVHLKGSLLTRMPGDTWQRFANLRLVLADQWTQPGKKLLFMGGEFGQWAEWNHDASLDWHLVDQDLHRGIQRLVADLNALYRRLPALHARDCAPGGLEWVDANDAENSTLSFLRHGNSVEETALVVFNCTPVPRDNFRVGVPAFDRWIEALNTDAREYGGSGVGNLGVVDASAMPHRQFPRSLTLRLPPLGALVLVPEIPRSPGPPGAPEKPRARKR